MDDMSTDNNDTITNPSTETPTTTIILIYSITIPLLITLLLLTILCYHFRKVKPLSTCIGQLPRLLILTLFGAITLTASPLIHSVEFCWLNIWLYELGFVLVFGCVILSQYKFLVEWRTRKAHRWIVREKDLLRYLTLFLFTTLIYLLSNGLNICNKNWFLLTTNLTEIVLILFTTWQLTSLRKTALHPIGKLFTLFLLLMQLLLEIINLNFLLFLTLTKSNALIWSLIKTCVPSLILIVLFSCKLVLCVRQRQAELMQPRGATIKKLKLDSKAAAVAGEQTLQLIDNINLDDMDMNEIRAELKRVYMQLELLRSKTMRLDNPHISRRRGGRKSTAASAGHQRRFSMQRKSGRGKKKSYQPPELTDYIEDSICSREMD